MNNNYRNKESTDLVTKMVILNNSIENTLSNIAVISRNINLGPLYIVSIIIDDKFEYEILDLEAPSRVIYLEIGVKFFMQKMLDNEDYDFWRYNNNTLYILRDGDYSQLKDLFTIIQKQEVNIVRGSSQKSHLISPIDFRLSCYMMILCNMDYKKFRKKNGFNYISKNRYLPYN